MGGGGEDNGSGGVTNAVKVTKADGSDAVKVNIQCSTGTKFAVQVSLESSVKSFKSVIAQNCDIPAKKQRLIYKGSILNDDQTLKSYGLEADHTVHMVRGSESATNNSTTTTTTGGGAGFLDMSGFPEFQQMQQQFIQNPNILMETMNLPLTQHLMDNPDVYRNMIMNHPQLRELVDRNPVLSHIFYDRDIFIQMTEVVRNPEVLREIVATIAGGGGGNRDTGEIAEALEATGGNAYAAVRLLGNLGD